MSPEQFAYWLQGFAELHPEPPTAEQWQSIREHLATAFQMVTPPFVSPPLRQVDLVSTDLKQGGMLGPGTAIC